MLHVHGLILKAQDNIISISVLTSSYSSRPRPCTLMKYLTDTVIHSSSQAAPHMKHLASLFSVVRVSREHHQITVSFPPFLESNVIHVYIKQQLKTSQPHAITSCTEETKNMHQMTLTTRLNTCRIWQKIKQIDRKRWSCK